MTTIPVVWALSALALSELYALACFAVITLVFTIIAVPLMFFLKAIYKVILGYNL